MVKLILISCQSALRLGPDVEASFTVHSGNGNHQAGSNKFDEQKD